MKVKLHMMKYFSRAAVLMLVVLLACAFLTAGCGEQHQKKVALLFSHEPIRWTEGGQMMKEQLEQDGMQAELTVFTTEQDQTAAIEAAVANKVDCIVIAGGDIKNLREGFEKAKEAHIPIIDYDNLTPDTDAVSYYVTFDNYGVGEAMGKYIVQKMNLRNGGGPYNVEFFSGSDTDSNAKLMYQGAYDVLKPYFDNGQLRVPSGQSDYASSAIKNWDGKNAEARMKELVSNYYQGQPLDIVVAASDGIAYGVIDGLAGYGGAWPLITGQDADKNARDYIRTGKMAFSIQKDSIVLNQKCRRMIKAVVDGSQPEINDVSSYSNGVITVPTYLCTPRIIDKDNLSAIED